jgi:hypothetical protein
LLLSRFVLAEEGVLSPIDFLSVKKGQGVQEDLGKISGGAAGRFSHF